MDELPYMRGLTPRMVQEQTIKIHAGLEGISKADKDVVLSTPVSLVQTEIVLLASFLAICTKRNRLRVLHINARVAELDIDIGTKGLVATYVAMQAEPLLLIEDDGPLTEHETFWIQALAHLISLFKSQTLAQRSIIAERAGAATSLLTMLLLVE